jgi:DNA-binding transcriptional MerR regulator
VTTRERCSTSCGRTLGSHRLDPIEQPAEQTWTAVGTRRSRRSRPGTLVPASSAVNPADPTVDLPAPSGALLTGMLQIGELAQLAGVTPRTIRHYHHTGLLPEPARAPNGYRTYGARALSRLVQIRRLSALGLGLAEIADALDAGSGTDMQEVLRELDAELAAQQAEIAQRRETIARLLEHGDDPTLSPELAEAVREMGLPVEEVDALRAAEFALPEMVEDYRAGLTHDEPSRTLTALFSELADADADDPRVEEIARAMHPILSAIVAAADPPPDGPPPPDVLRFGEMVIADLSDGQRRAMELLMEYGQAAQQPD